MSKVSPKPLALLGCCAIFAASLLLARAGTVGPEPRLVFVDMKMTARLANKDAPFPPYVRMLTL